MDFATTARFLMDIQKDHPGMTFRFDSWGHLLIDLPVNGDVPAMFGQAAEMFRPV